jgi:hypothetical protein
MDVDYGNGNGPCAPVDDHRTSVVDTTILVALCVIDSDMQPLSGGITTLTLSVAYGPQLIAANMASNLTTDLASNPDWNEAGLGGAAAWDCNLLNGQASAPRAAPSPGTITCSTTSLTDHPVSGNVLLATLMLEATAPGTAVLSWDSATSILAGNTEPSCADGLTCLGATIVVVPD